MGGWTGFVVPLAMSALFPRNPPSAWAKIGRSRVVDSTSDVLRL
jgi:hypothetical protein